MGYPPPHAQQPPAGPPRRDYAPVVILIGAVTLLLAAVAALLIVFTDTGSGGTSLLGGGQQAQAAQDKSESTVRRVAQQAFDAYSAASYGEFWDLWSQEGQEAISRDDYVSVFEQCPQVAQNLRFTIGAVTVTGDSAKVQANRLIGAFTFDFAYQDERWRYVPQPEQMAEYQSKSVDEMVAAKKAAGTCAAPKPGA